MLEKKFISEKYLESLGPIYRCPKGCGGTLIQVYVRYKQGDKIKKEYECSRCGKVVKGNMVSQQQGEGSFRKRKKWQQNNNSNQPL